MRTEKQLERAEYLIASTVRRRLGLDGTSLAVGSVVIIGIQRLLGK
jgi:hypothetical protein